MAFEVTSSAYSLSIRSLKPSLAVVFRLNGYLRKACGDPLSTWTQGAYMQSPSVTTPRAHVIVYYLIQRFVASTGGVFASQPITTAHFAFHFSFRCFLDCSTALGNLSWNLTHSRSKTINGLPPIPATCLSLYNHKCRSVNVSACFSQ